MWSVFSDTNFETNIYFGLLNLHTNSEKTAYFITTIFLDFSLNYICLKKDNG